MRNEIFISAKTWIYVLIGGTDLDQFYMVRRPTNNALLPGFTGGGGDVSAVAAAVQACRLGVAGVVLVNDILRFSRVRGHKALMQK